ncbi:MAG: hypothetical protein JXB25_00565 [Deltaproteobacteria bacterium]|nr:hypothetical protein [Deltaproteobacteria bacterium]
MKPLGRFFFQALLLAVALLALDLGLTHLPDSPGLAVPRRIYLDFRTRLVALLGPNRDPIATQIVAGGKTLPPAAGTVVAKPGEPRYFYVDQRGDIRFAATLEEIPSEYRGEAKKLER